MQNEPNFKNTQINVRSFKGRNYAIFHSPLHRKNEPNLRRINPDLLWLCCHGLQFAIFLLTPTNACVQLYVPHRGFRPKQHTFTEPLITVHEPRIKNMQNEPNFKNTKINLSDVRKKNYEKKQLFTHRKNEPNSCPSAYPS